MMADPGAVRPSAVDVLDRFFADLRTRRTPSDCPPRATFDTAARSEPTLAILLRTLKHFVPEMVRASSLPSAMTRRGSSSSNGTPPPRLT